MNLFDLNEDQQGHMFFLLDKHTGNAMGFNRSLCTGKQGDMTLEDAFQGGGSMGPRKAMRLAAEVASFKMDPTVKLHAQIRLATYQRISLHLLEEIKGQPDELVQLILKDARRLLDLLSTNRKPKKTKTDPENEFDPRVVL